MRILATAKKVLEALRIKAKALLILSTEELVRTFSL